ncbi:MAG: hypothetical protein AABZ39_15355 [Spirochaetota bacterium]
MDHDKNDSSKRIGSLLSMSHEELNDFWLKNVRIAWAKGRTALNEIVPTIDDDFLKKSLMLMTDGVPEGVTKDILEGIMQNVVHDVLNKYRKSMAAALYLVEGKNEKVLEELLHSYE